MHPRSLSFEIWSTTAHLVVDDPAALPAARTLLEQELTSIERACSRFHPGTEITSVLARPGRQIQLSEVLNDVMSEALRVARATHYLVDPTVASAVIGLGYDRDISDVVGRSVRLATAARRPAPGSWRLEHDPARRLLRVPIGVGIDLGATAKALAADRAAGRIFRTLGCGVLVNLGGDVAVAGPPPDGGWRIDIADDHRNSAPAHQTVAIATGGLATSSTTSRRWQTTSFGADRTVHHIVDPRTGGNPAPYWRTASVAAASCVDANAAATAALILGAAASEWLDSLQLASRLVGVDGRVRCVGGWPVEALAA